MSSGILNGRPVKEGVNRRGARRKSEFQHRLATRRQANPGGLRRDKLLEVDQVQQRRLEQLTLEDRTLNPQQRFLRKDRWFPPG